MAHVQKFYTTVGDTIAAIARPDVAVACGLRAEDARLLYPFAVAVVVINSLKTAELPTAVVELEGFDTFRTRVRGEFRASHLEDWEVREAFDIIRAYARNPRAPLRFKFSTKEQERTMGELLGKLQVH